MRGRQGGLDQFGADAALRQIAPDSQRSVPAIRVVGHELQCIALIVDVTALAELGEHGLCGGGFEALRLERLQQLERSEVASCQQSYRSCAGCRGVGALTGADPAPRRSFPQHVWAATA